MPKLKTKYARTYFKDLDGTIRSGRLNLETGEIKPYAYKSSVTVVKATPKVGIKKIDDYTADGGLLGYTPQWALMPPPDFSRGVLPLSKSQKTKQNDNNYYLQEYMLYAEAVEDHPVIDDLFSGVDNAATRPINRGLLFCMLRDLDVIDAPAIQAYIGYSAGYSSRLAQYLRILSNAFDREIESTQ